MMSRDSEVVDRGGGLPVAYQRQSVWGDTEESLMVVQWWCARARRVQRCSGAEVPSGLSHVSAGFLVSRLHLAKPFFSPGVASVAHLGLPQRHQPGVRSQACTG